MVGRWIILFVILALAFFAVYATLPPDAGQRIGRLVPIIELATSPDAVAILLDRYAVFAIGLLVAFAAGLFLLQKLRKIQVQLDNLQGDVNRLNLIETRRFLGTLNCGATGGVENERVEEGLSSIISEVADGEGKTESVGSKKARRSR